MNEVLLEPHERQPCEVWSRVMGYHRPVAQWNIGKKCEHRDRRFFADPTGRWDVYGCFAATNTAGT